MLQEGRRSVSDGFQNAGGGQSRWLAERAALMVKAGHTGQAADLYQKAGNAALADQQRALARPGVAEGLTRRIPLDLEMRWNALRQIGGQSDGKIAVDPAVVQEAIRISAENGLMEGTIRSAVCHSGWPSAGRSGAQRRQA